ncbi:MAG: hypothetical protein U0263_09285 [Polyangiaceae bacterium]
MRAFVLLALGLLACAGGDGGEASNAGGAVGSGAASGSGGTHAAGGVGSGGTAALGGGGSGGTSAGGASGGTGADLCTTSAGNFFAHGDFEEGMDGQAPKGWEVRTPGQPDKCAGSGAPGEHVFLTTPAPGCSGQALAVDARGEWDCYAVQRVTDYDSIQGGATYRISASVRSTGNATNPAAWFVIGAQWLDGSDAFFGDEKNPKTASASENDYEWKKLSFDLVAPANARRILIWLSAHYPGRVDIDNVSVVKL